MVIDEPLSSFNVMSLPALLESVAVYVICPPSLASAGAVSVTVVVSTESVMVVSAGVVLGTRFSKLPPVAPVMVVLMVLPLT
ncbi:hypothetical protein [Pseudomonas sp. 37 R 15]|nr:hypothetical protein [Pseudomonas sp. 37 R 15]